MIIWRRYVITVPLLLSVSDGPEAQVLAAHHATHHGQFRVVGQGKYPGNELSAVEDVVAMMKMGDHLHDLVPGVGTSVAGLGGYTTWARSVWLSGCAGMGTNTLVL